MIGIYAIFRKSDNKCMYVGQSKCIERRYYDHFSRKNSRFNTNEYTYKQVEIFDFYDKENQLNREAYWINELNPELNRIINRKPDEELRKQISERTKGENNPMFGKHHTEESNEKNRISHLGKYDGENNPMYGKNPYDFMTKTEIEICKNKISIALQGREPWNKGKQGCFSKESLERMSKSRTGKHHSEETKQKLRHPHKITKKHWKLIDGRRVWY